MSEIRDAAITFESQSMILRKDKTSWVLGLRVHPDDMPRHILEAPLGTRFQCVLLEINDDETFVIPDEVRKGKKAVAIAGQMCREEMFQNWMLDNWMRDSNRVSVDPDAPVESVTAELLRNHLEIESRSDLLEDEQARDKFRELIKEYRNDTREGHLPGSDY